MAIDTKLSGNYSDLDDGPRVFSVQIPGTSWFEANSPLRDLPRDFCEERDALLRATVRHEDLWSQAVGIAITITASWGWRVDGDIPLRVKRMQQLLLAADTQGFANGQPWGHGWTHFLTRHLRDYILTDNGAFVRIVRARRAFGSRIIGIQHLSSARCTRTGDAEIPVIYNAPDGNHYGLRPHQVFSLSDMPDSEESALGSGLCAASRAYRTIRSMVTIADYMETKISGKRPLAIDFIKGVVGGTARAAVEEAKAGGNQSQAASRFHTTGYMGAVIAEVMGDTSLEHVRIDLADLPDGFDLEQERSHALLSYANALGLDPQDIQPLTGRALGTAAQSRVLDEKSDVKGLELWRKSFEHAVNMWITDETTKFVFTSNDDAKKIAKADLDDRQISRLATMVDAQIITPAQALQMAVDAEQAPREFIEDDQTAQIALDDNDASATAQAQQDAARVADAAAEVEEVEKAISRRQARARANLLVEQEIDAARELAANL